MNIGRLLSAAVTAVAFGCGGTPEDSRESRATSVDSARAPDSTVAWAVRPTRDYLTCSPSFVGPDSVLVLRMRTPHGASLYIGSPDRTLYLIVFHGQGNPDRAARKSLLTPEAFSQLTELRLNVGTLSGGPWVFGRDTNEVVFRAPGLYRIRVGNDMETDGPDYAECAVTFAASK